MRKPALFRIKIEIDQDCHIAVVNSPEKTRIMRRELFAVRLSIVCWGWIESKVAVIGENGVVYSNILYTFF